METEDSIQHEMWDSQSGNTAKRRSSGVWRRVVVRAVPCVSIDRDVFIFKFKEATNYYDI